MAEDLIRYDILAQDALRGVVRKVLSEVSKTGLPGEHHFFISFHTRAAGVRISSRLLAQYPEEMTIVIQHQYWDLTVTEHAFEIGLSFGGVPERLLVPFTAVKGFFDPSVPFSLQFEAQPASAAKAPAPVEAPAPAAAALPVRAAEPEPEEPAPAPAGDAQVVRLDAFRKK
ncbi:MAG TPA: ClpXP protease specificity-enhancing factor SspB [Bauldia sp.]|nr:ClpXP protease specificity-enhancing factor SspB [Bauldia sp.]